MWQFRKNNDNQIFLVIIIITDIDICQQIKNEKGYSERVKPFQLL